MQNNYKSVSCFNNVDEKIILLSDLYHVVLRQWCDMRNIIDMSLNYPKAQCSQPQLLQDQNIVLSERLRYILFAASFEIVQNRVSDVII